MTETGSWTGKQVDLDETLTRLEKLEGAFISSLREVRSIKAEIQKQANGNSTLEPLLEAEDVAKILGVEIVLPLQHLQG